MMNETKVESRLLPSSDGFTPASQAQFDWLNSRAELLLGGGSVGSL